MDFERRPHEQLDVYSVAHALGVRVHIMTLQLPKFEHYEEGSQSRRSSKSVSSQIVEGHALRQYKAEYEHYLGRAYASGEETIENLKYLLETGSAKGLEHLCEPMIDEYGDLCRKLYNYKEAVHRQHDSRRPSSRTKP